MNHITVAEVLSNVLRWGFIAVSFVAVSSPRLVEVGFGECDASLMPLLLMPSYHYDYDPRWLDTDNGNQHHHLQHHTNNSLLPSFLLPLHNTKTTSNRQQQEVASQRQNHTSTSTSWLTCTFHKRSPPPFESNIQQANRRTNHDSAFVCHHVRPRPQRPCCSSFRQRR